MNEEELLELQIDATKAALAGKLEALEGQVAGAVQATTDTVSEAVDAVRDTVNTVKEKVQDAGEFLSLSRQAEAHPWAVFGSSVAAGLLTGLMLGGSKRAGVTGVKGTVPEVAGAGLLKKAPEEKPSWLREQMSHLSGLAVGTLMAALREVAAENLPDDLGKRVSQEVDHLTASFGVDPIPGPVLSRLNEWLTPEEVPPVTPSPGPAARPTSRATSSKAPAI